MLSFRAFTTGIAVAFLTCALAAPFAFAQAADAPTREIWKAGDMTVSIIQDLPTEMSASIFSGPASPEERAKYFNNGKAESSINVFLLRAGGKIALFDAGAGSLFPSPGRLPEILASLGFKPENIDFIVLTHMHGDHVGGLLREDARAFPKAKVLVAKQELDSWLALAEKTAAGSESLAAGTALLAKKVAAAYGSDIQTFAFGDNPLPGVTAIDASGHTPGHTVFQLNADGKNLLIVGDLVHAMFLQLALPDECASYDMDKPMAAAARKRILALAEEKAIPVAGMHFPLANVIGTVKKDGGGWKFEQAR